MQSMLLEIGKTLVVLTIRYVTRGYIDIRVDSTLEMWSCTTEFEALENAWIVHVGRSVVMRTKILGGTTAKRQISLEVVLI
jgi:hypothetical protein